jgi:hypothetical protein
METCKIASRRTVSAFLMRAQVFTEQPLDRVNRCAKTKDGSARIGFTDRSAYGSRTGRHCGMIGRCCSLRNPDSADRRSASPVPTRVSLNAIHQSREPVSSPFRAEGDSAPRLCEQVLATGGRRHNEHFLRMRRPAVGLCAASTATLIPAKNDGHPHGATLIFVRAQSRVSADQRNRRLRHDDHGRRDEDEHPDAARTIERRGNDGETDSVSGSVVERKRCYRALNDPDCRRLVPSVMGSRY